MRTLPTTALCSLLLGCATPASATTTPVTAAAAPAAKAPTDRLDVETLVDLKAVSDVALSPDGKSIAYVLRVPPDSLDAPGSQRSELWVVPTRGGTPRRFSTPTASASSPAWAPDGRTIAFLSRRADSPDTQVYAVPIDGGEAVALTTQPTSVRAFWWSPKGEALAVLADREPTEAEKKAKAEGRDWHASDVHGSFRRLWRVEAKTGKATPITPRDQHVLQAAWAPDGARLAVQAGTRADVDGTMMYSDVFTVAASGGELSPVVPGGARKGKLGHIEWSPDGKTIAFLSAVDLSDPTAGVLFVAPATGGPARALTADYEGTGAWFRFADAKTIVMLANQGTATALHRVGLDGTMRRSTVTGPVCRVVDATANGKTIACAGETPSHPREVFAGAPGSLSRRTDSNPQLEGIHLGERRVIRWKAQDGLEIEGVLTLPVGYTEGTRYPLAVLPHGGPEGISLNGWNTRAGYPTQLFATHGYVVLEPNYRGSQGRGVAFGKADQGDLGGKEFDDVLAGIDHLVAQGLVDEARVGMGGWSYGGYFSGLAATVHSKRFAAAMVGAAITNWISFTGTSEIEHENSLVHWNLWPYENHALVWDRSPMAHTQGSTTATLVVHGDEDTRVPPGQAKELYRALRHAGTTTEVVFYPREGHGLRERAHQIDFATRFVTWFDRHVKDKR